MNPSSPYAGLADRTVWEMLEHTAARLPDKVAFIEGDTRLTFAGLRERADRLARGIAGLGLTKGDVAAVYMKNSLELVTAFYALQKLGVVIAWINPAYREKEAAYVLEDTGAKAAFVFEEWQGFNYRAALTELMPELPNFRHLVLAGASGAAEAPATTFDQLFAAADGGAEPELPAVGPADLSMMLYTSGTTGKSKGAMIAQSQVVRAGKSYALPVDATEDDVLIGFLPMAHSYGCGALLMQPVVLGATVVVLDRFSPRVAFELIQKERVTVQPAAPAHYLMELDAPQRSEYDLSSLRAGTIAGQIAPAGLIRRVQEEMDMYLSSFLGSSEVGPGLSIYLPYQTDLETREEYIGAPIDGTAVKVIDPATGVELPDGEEGELLLSGWHVMQGYWKKPEETANQLKDGWLHTGDLVRRGPNGYVQILGRLKEWINRGGFKIIPSEIESLLVQHPAVAEACVVNTPNPVLGESICACVRLVDETGSLTLDEIREFLTGKVAQFKLPDELLLMNEFPRMPGGLKVNRFGAGGVVEVARNAADKQTVHPSR